MNATRKKIAIAHPQMGRGGSEAAVMWGIEALKQDYALTLVTSCKVDLNALNRFYGTAVAADDITIRLADMPDFIRCKSSAAALRGAFYQRYCRKIAPEYDALISAYNVCDFGVPAIHMIADFSWDEEIRGKYDSTAADSRQFIHNPGLVRKGYLWLAGMISNPSGRNLYDNKDMLLANSQWTADIMLQKYGAVCDVLYPPVFEEFPEIEDSKKESGFVCIGRISPEKRIDRIIDILRAVRMRGHDVHLHIIGGMDNSAYSRYVASLCRQEGGWIILDGQCFGDKKRTLIAGHRFGIHGRAGEPFGIAVAEMVKAGCITFVPAGGGQTEIVGHEELLYKDEEDAVEKIDRVLKNMRLQKELSKQLEKHGERFSCRVFQDAIRQITRAFLQQKGHHEG